MFVWWVCTVETFQIQYIIPWCPWSSLFNVHLRQLVELALENVSVRAVVKSFTVHVLMSSRCLSDRTSTTNIALWFCLGRPLLRNVGRVNVRVKKDLHYLVRWVLLGWILKYWYTNWGPKQRMHRLIILQGTTFTTDYITPIPQSNLALHYSTTGWQHILWPTIVNTDFVLYSAAKRGSWKLLPWIQPLHQGTHYTYSTTRATTQIQQNLQQNRAYYQPHHHSHQTLPSRSHHLSSLQYP